MIRVHLHIYGLVQGVFYRKYAKNMADQLHLTGYISNHANGSVICEIEGKKAQINAFIEWAKKGSPGAQVNRIDQRQEQITSQKYTNFTIK